MPLRYLALIVAVLPFIAANLCYLVSAWQGHVEWCIPYLHGCTSISAAARHGSAFYLFKILMFPSIVLMVIYWRAHCRWLAAAGDPAAGIRRAIMLMGVVAPLGLALYTSVLGLVGDLYFLQRRIGIVLYFALTFLAQLLLTYRLSTLVSAAARAAYRAKFLLICLMWGLGLLHLFFEVTRPEFDAIDDIIEWNFALLATLFYASSYFLWKKE
ncbi:MAG: hypothetical protein HKO84_01905 [Pseudomonadales bacterium]|nr:hypothetical protein [Pseudomonadales bacterium]